MSHGFQCPTTAPNNFSCSLISICTLALCYERQYSLSLPTDISILTRIKCYREINRYKPTPQGNCHIHLLATTWFNICTPGFFTVSNLFVSVWPWQPQSTYRDSEYHRPSPDCSFRLIQPLASSTTDRPELQNSSDKTLQYIAVVACNRITTWAFRLSGCRAGKRSKSFRTYNNVLQF